jgi:hypothetical protein
MSGIYQHLNATKISGYISQLPSVGTTLALHHQGVAAEG